MVVSPLTPASATLAPRHKPFAGHERQRRGEAKLDKLPLPAGHVGVFQHRQARRHRGGSDMELHFEVVLDFAWDGFQDLQFRLGHQGRLEQVVIAQSAMPRRTASWSSSGMFSATHSPALPSVASSP